MVLLEQEELPLWDFIKPHVQAGERDLRSRYSLLFYFFNIYLFGCIRSQLRHAGSSLWHTGSFVVACRLFVATRGLLSSCGVWASLQLWRAGSRACGLSSCGAWSQLPRGMWDLSSPTRDRTHVPCIGRWILNHWTTREVPIFIFKVKFWFIAEKSLRILSGQLSTRAKICSTKLH